MIRSKNSFGLISSGNILAGAINIFQPNSELNTKVWHGFMHRKSGSRGEHNYFQMISFCFNKVITRHQFKPPPILFPVSFPYYSLNFEFVNICESKSYLKIFHLHSEADFRSKIQPIYVEILSHKITQDNSKK